MRHYTFLLFLFIFFHSCANYKLNYSSEVKDWQAQSPPSEAIDHSVFLIGDVASVRPDSDQVALAALRNSLLNTQHASTLVILGNSLGEENFEYKSKAEKKQDRKERLEAMLPFLNSYAGRVFMVAGEHDWHEYGVKGLQKEAKYIKNGTDKQVQLLPRPGCGDPVEVKLNDDIVLLLLDSQWWLANWNGETDVNVGCEAKSRADFSFMMREIIKGNRRKHILLAMHHPIYSNGPHGGKYSFDQHLFPLRDLNKNLYLPLPVVGSFYRLLQSTIGGRQDLANTTYKDLRTLLDSKSKLADGIVFAAAHEHSMQYWEKEDNFHIISGAATQKTATKATNGALFAYGELGFSRLDYYKDGQVWVNYFKALANGEKELVFRHQVKDSKPPVEEIPPSIATSTIDTSKTIVRPLSKFDFSRSSFGEKFWGEHYRETYGDSLAVKAIDLAALNLKPLKQGGGFQTNSLRLEETTTKRHYTLRSIDKDASLTVPYPLNTKAVLNVVTDNFSAAHPLAALAVVPMAEAAGIYHTNPRIVYLPQQTALGDFNEAYAGQLYLFEERPDGKHWDKAEHFGFPDNIIGTLDMIEKVNAYHKNRVDQKWVIKSRLFDLFLGDWDRHDDQWRWAKIEEGDINYYRPIPRDRDQAFGNYDGFVFRIAHQIAPISKQWRPFNDKVVDTKWTTNNAALFDRSFLSELDWNDWLEAVHALQEKLTDEVIDAAFATAWPDSYQKRDAPKITSTLKGKRDNLEAIAWNYYEHLASSVDVMGTDQKDLFLIERIDNESTRIRIYDTNKDGDKEDLLYDRTFKNSETKDIYCYGLEDDDIFEVRGQTKKAIKVHLTGGQGKDIFDDTSVSTHSAKAVIVYDFKDEKNKIVNDSDTRDKRDNNPANNHFNRRGAGHKYNFNQVFPLPGFNPDDGFTLGITGLYTHYGFRKEPYASKHYYNGFISLSRGGASVSYLGEYIDVFGKWDVQLDALWQTPLYNTNYYGLGNETINREDELGNKYHNIRQSFFTLSPKLAWFPNEELHFSFGPRFQSISIERTENRFIDEIGDEFPDELFDGLHLFNLEAELTYNNVDITGFPTRGINLESRLGWTTELLDEDDTPNYEFPFLDASFTIYQQLDAKGKFVFASRVGLLHRFTDDFPFYMGAQLGGLGDYDNLRGYRRNRFTGRTAFFHNNDLRLKVLKWNNQAVPMSIGLSASFDYGKVSLDDIKSEEMHYSYGGGLFILPFDIVSLNVGAYQAHDGELRWLLKGGFFF